MDAIVDSLAEQHAELTSLLRSLDEAGWQRPTRCEGWSVGDVVLHLAQSDELALASAQGRFDAGVEALAGGTGPTVDVDAGAAALVDRERGRSGADVFERWRRTAAALRDELAASDPHRRVEWVAGTLSVRTLVATRLAECWIHTGDVADATGVTQVPTDRIQPVARLAWRTLPYAFARDGRDLHGPVAFDLQAPSGARWYFEPDAAPATVITGSGAELCLVAARRVPAGETSLRGAGPDAAAVLELVRTYA